MAASRQQRREQMRMWAKFSKQAVAAGCAESARECAARAATCARLAGLI